MKKKPSKLRLRFGTAKDAAEFYPLTQAEVLRQIATMVPLSAYGQTRLEKAEREEAEAKLKKSAPATKKPRR